MIEKIALVILIAVGAASTMLAYSQKDECEKHGGWFVKGVFWYECITK